MSLKRLALAVGSVCLLAGCGNSASGYRSPQAIAAAIGCHGLVVSPNLPTYRRGICEYQGHRVAISWFPKDGESAGFMIASRGDGFVLGDRWLVKCWYGPDCLAIQRTIGGKAGISTGHA